MVDGDDDDSDYDDNEGQKIIENDRRRIRSFHLTQLPVASHKGGPRGIQKSRLAINLVISISKSYKVK